MRASGPATSATVSFKDKTAIVTFDDSKTDVTALTDEVANARIWSGFHYRFSTVVGSEMGQKIGAYVVKSAMQPVQTATLN